MKKGIIFILFALFGLMVGSVSAETHTQTRQNTITVADGFVGVANDGNCSIQEAIKNGEASNSSGIIYSDCAAGNPTGADTIVLAANGNYSFFLRPRLSIDTEITIDGNGATLENATNGFFRTNDTLILLNSTLQEADDSAIDGGGNLVVRDSIFLRNVSASNHGGAIYLVWSSASRSLFVDNATFENNVALNGGAIAIKQESPISNSLVDIVRSTFSNNGFWSGVADQTSQGGAINLDGGRTRMFATISNSTFFANSSTFAGGATSFREGVETIIEHTTFEQNSADSVGGAVQNFLADTFVKNSTFSGNNAAQGGAIYNAATDLFPRDSFVLLDFVTITENHASSGGGFYNRVSPTTNDAVIHVKNSIIFGNTAPSFNLDCFNDGGTVTSFGYNATGGSPLTGCSLFGTNYLTLTGAVSTHLNPLALNGGTNKTHSVIQTSPIINHIPANTNGCNNDLRDQRYYKRTGLFSTPNCDVGAFEWKAVVSVPTAITLSGQSSAISGQPGINWMVFSSLLLMVATLALWFRNAPSASGFFGRKNRGYQS